MNRLGEVFRRGSRPSEVFGQMTSTVREALAPPVVKESFPTRSRASEQPLVKAFTLVVEISGPWSQWGEIVGSRSLEVQRAVEKAIQGAVPNDWKTKVAVKHGA